jgi:hypothetical protein
MISLTIRNPKSEIRNGMITSSSPSPTASATWRANVHSSLTGQFLLRLQVKAPNLKTAEQNALAIAALNLRLGPTELTIPRLNQIA